MWWKHHSTVERVMNLESKQLIQPLIDWDIKGKLYKVLICSKWGKNSYLQSCSDNCMRDFFYEKK